MKSETLNFLGAKTSTGAIEKMDIKRIPDEILFSVRKRYGAEENNDTTYDETIAKLSPKQLMEKWSAWKLGDEYWGRYIISMYEALKSVEADNKN